MKKEEIPEKRKRVPKIPKSNVTKGLQGSAWQTEVKPSGVRWWKIKYVRIKIKTESIREQAENTKNFFFKTISPLYKYPKLL